MADLRTEITEIVTGLSMLGYRELDHALGVRPRLVSNVTEAHFDRLIEARDKGEFADEFETAWDNGHQFAYSEHGLRGRAPWRLEWKGPHRPPAYEQIPADLRIDHVYLVSCKYGSNVLMNASPSHVFDRLLAERRGGQPVDWFAQVSPAAHKDLWQAYRSAVDDQSLPIDAAQLTAADRKVLKAATKGRAWPSEEAAEAYKWMVVDVSNQSAERWLNNLDSDGSREEMLWRLLRFAPSPYFVLGRAIDGTPLRYRVATPWDFRQAFELKAFDAWGDALGQPVVQWRAEMRRRADGAPVSVKGHIEVRWSHGRFGGMPEAKVYLDTPHHEVPGYFPI